jgi:hypothetical protein
LNSTPSSTPVSTTEPKLTIQTEDVPDKAATSVSMVQSTDYLSTTTTVAEAHKTTETESHSSKVNSFIYFFTMVIRFMQVINGIRFFSFIHGVFSLEMTMLFTLKAGDTTQSTTESNVSIIAKTVEMCINIPKHTIKRKADTSDVQLKSAKIPASSKQTENLF